jgi:hypothetical protein
MKSMFANINKAKKATAIAVSLAALFFAACGDDGVNGISIADINGGKPPPPAGLKLKTLSIYYAKDEAKTSLLHFTSSTGDYTITDAASDKGALIVEAEAETADARTLISWKRGSAQGSGDSASGLVKLPDIPLPGIESNEAMDTIITIIVSKDNKSYPYKITSKAPGVDSSLEHLSFRYADGLTQLSDWVWENNNDFWNGELLYDKMIKEINKKTYTAFDGSSQYVIELPAEDKDKAGSNVAITAIANDGDSVITLTVNGEEVEEGTPAAPNTSGGDKAAVDTEKAAAVSKRWLVQIPPAGEESLTIALKVTNGEVFSAYTITLVPPPDDKDVKDTRLLNIQFKDKKDVFIIPQSSEAGGFNSGITTYQFSVSGFTGPFTIESCAPSYEGADVVITYTVNGGSPQEIQYPEYMEKEIPKPPTDGLVVVKFRVTVGNDELNAREYSVTFTNPSGSLSWKGTVALNGDGSSQYTITGLDAITSGNASHTATMTGDKWDVTIDEKQANAANPPVSFRATLTAKDGARYCVMNNVSVISPNTDYTSNTLTFTVGATNSKENPLYKAAYTAQDLADMAKNGNQNVNYYLANDVDLTALKENWDGPDKYSGHFNGGGNTVTLALSKGNSDTGLFDSLATGAIIENLNVKVRTKDNAPLNITSGIHFGGVIGGLTTGNYTIRGIKISGTLMFTGGYNYLYAGALIGEVQQNNTVNLLVEDCEADIDIINTTITGYMGNGFGFGGLIGKNASTNGSSITIRNSRSGGKINVKSSYNETIASTNGFSAGGIIGIEGLDSESISDTLIIENCYSSMEIVIERTSSTARTSAGGLIGSLNNAITNSQIINSVALNPKVLAIASSNASSGRVIGRKAAFSGQLSNYALTGMITGTTAAGAPNNSAGVEEANDGLGKTAQELSNSGFWTDTAKFNADNWDFSGLNIKSPEAAGSVYPKLKN